MTNVTDFPNERILRRIDRAKVKIPRAIMWAAVALAPWLLIGATAFMLSGCGAVGSALGPAIHDALWPDFHYTDIVKSKEPTP